MAFLIVLAVLAVIIIAVLSLSATITLVYDKGWHTKIKVLFIEKEVVLSKVLSFILFPEKKAKDVTDENKKKKESKKKSKEKKAVKENQPKANTSQIKEQSKEAKAESDKKEKSKSQKPKKNNPIKQIWDDEGVVGILSLVSNLAETASSAVLTFFRGFHIYSLYVMIIVGGGDASQIAMAYGTLCKYYYPVKGMILNGMKVDNYDDYIQPDFIANKTEFEMQFIGSISVGLLLKTVLKAGIVFLKNIIKNKGDKN